MSVMRSLYVGIISTTSIFLAPSHLNNALAQLAPQEISAISKPVTVRIDGTEEGSGVIIEKLGNTYTVLTNWHVVEAKGQYIIQTHNGQKHTIEYSQIHRLSNDIDLALIKFASNTQYETAELGESDTLKEGQTIYLAGYPGNGQIIGESDRFYRFNSLNINAILPNSRQGGYSLAYGGENFSGMSGSPIFNSDGDLIGVNGITYQDADGKARSNYAIPSSIYKELSSLDQNLVPNNNTKYVLEHTLDNKSWVNSVTVSGNKIFSGDEDKIIRMWNLDTGVLEKTFEGHSDEVWSVAVSGNKVVSGSKDKTIKIWNLNTGVLEKNLSGHSDWIWSVAIDNNKIVSGSRDKTIKIWDLDTGVLKTTLTGHSDEVSSVAVSGNKVVSGSDDKTIKIWNSDTGISEKTLIGHSDEVWSVAVSGNKVVSGSKDKTIRIWDLDTGILEKTLTDNSGWIYSVAINKNRIVSGSSDKTVKVWNLDTGILETTLTGHSATVWGVAINQNKIVSGGKDEDIRIWNLRQ